MATATPHLVPLPDAVIPSRGSGPRDFLRIGSVVYFLANDGVRGQQLWRTDGTERGTGQASAVPWDVLGYRQSTWRRMVVRLDDSVVFFTEDGRLWRSDGTPASTTKLADLPDGYLLLASGSVQTIGAGSRVYILTLRQDGTNIYVVDGNPSALRLLGKFPALLDPTPIGAGGKLYFAGKDDVAGAQVWVSDGTPTSTRALRSNLECPGPACTPFEARAFFNIGERIYFTTDDGVWNADGISIAPLDHPYFLTSTDSAAYLLSNQTVWKTDGTAAGTSTVALPEWFDLHVLDDGRFVALQPFGRTFDVWISDGTPAGSRKLGSMPMESFQSPFIGSVGGRALYAAYTKENGNELWEVDADRGTVGLLKDLDPRFGTGFYFNDPNPLNGLGPYSSNPTAGIVLGSNVIFAATGAAGTEPWISDGTAAGTKLLADIAADNTAGALSGTVRDAVTGAPVAGVQVSACSGSPPPCGDVAVTDAAGHYRLDDVLPYSYIVTAVSRAHIAQAYPTPVTIAAGFETAGVDFALDPGGKIGGTVRRAAAGEPLANVSIIVYSGDKYAGSVTTGADGSYLYSGLDTGSYTVQASAPDVSPAVANQIYAGKDCSPDCDRDAATPVAVTRGQETKGVDFPLDDGGTIAGTVRDASNNAPLAGIRVLIDGIYATRRYVSTTTDANGRYDSGPLPSDTYWVCIQNTDGYDGNCTYLPLPANRVTIIDQSLTQKQGRVTGVVRDRNGAPLPHLAVDVRIPTRTVATGTTDGQGRYLFYGLAPGPYAVHAVDEEVPFTVAAGQTVTADLPLHSLRSTISGRLLDAVTGDRIGTAAGSVEAYDDSGHRIASATLANGAYQLDVVSQAAAFYLAANTPAYHAMAYPSLRTTCAASCVIPPVATAFAPGPRDNVDFLLPRRGSFSGVVTDALTGAPVASANVDVISNGAHTIVTADAAGRYRAFGEGSFTAFAGQSQYVSQLYRDRDCGVECDLAKADAIAVADGIETTGIDFHLRPRMPVGSVGGRVVDADSGAPVANAKVFGYLAGPLATTQTDAAGKYTLSPVPGGSYRLSASPQGAYFDTFDVPVTVTPPKTTTLDLAVTRLHVTSIDPPRGPASGGTLVTITGANFRPGMLVSIGGQRAAVVRATATEIVAVTPAAGEGVANVTVFATPYPSVTLTQAFTYGAALPPKSRAVR